MASRRTTSTVALVVIFAAFALALCTPPKAHGLTTRSACERVVSDPGHCAVVKVYGHRAKEGLNENTIKALRYDHRHNVGFETDTWRLRGPDGPMTGISVIFHDGPLGRVVSADSIAAAGLTPETDIFDVTWAQFQILRTKGGEPLPTLHQWIRKAGEWHVPGFIEIKHDEIDPVQAAGWKRQYHAPVSFYGIPDCDANGNLIRNPLLDLGMKVGVKYESGTCKPSPAEMAAEGYTYVTHFNNQIAKNVARLHRWGLLAGGFALDETVWKAVVEARVDFIIAPDPVEVKRWLR